MRVRWFSWFISGPAKATWLHRTLNPADKSSWKRIVEVYKGQYGIHLNPRTAYQRCNELRYDQLASAQGLLDAMRDYQRMAPHKLTDGTLESILWNKIPVELQQEVKEITDGLVQELLQRLLRAEVVLAERKRSQYTEVASKITSSSQERGQGQINRSTTRDHGRTGRRCTISSPATGEMSSREVKCFNCHKKGHIAKHCPNFGTPPRTPVRATMSTATVSANGTAEKEESENVPNEKMWKWTRILSTVDSKDQNL